MKSDLSVLRFDQASDNRFLRIRFDVRESLRIQVSDAMNDSIMLNAGMLFVSIVKMIVYRTLPECSTEPQLCLWFFLMFIHDVIYTIHILILLSAICFHRHRGIMSHGQSFQPIYQEYQESANNPSSENLNGFFVSESITRKHWLNSFLYDSTKIFYLIIFIQGNLLIFYHEDEYLGATPHHFYVALAFVVMGYFYLGIPLFFFASICFCMPFMLIMYLVVRRRRQEFSRGLGEELISTIPITNAEQIDKRQSSEVLECCICLGEYEQSEQVIVLPCNHYHHFHAECLKRWLKISSECPICKQNVKTMIVPLTDQQSPPNPQRRSSEDEPYVPQNYNQDDLLEAHLNQDSFMSEPRMIPRYNSQNWV